MNTAVIALLSALSVAGVGTTAVAVSNGHMMGGQSMMGDQSNGWGMHDGMHDWGNGTYGGHHGGCHCCDDDEGNNTGQGQPGLSP